MQNMFWALVDVLTEAVNAANLAAEEPPFNEGPHAERQNQMSEEAPREEKWHGGV